MSTLKIKPIKNENDYREAVINLKTVFDSPLNTEEGDLAEILSILIIDWENKNYPILDEDINDKWSIDHLQKLVDEACELEKNITLSDKGLKLSEEVGELSAEILKFNGVKYSNLTEGEKRNKLLLESCDVLIMIFSIMHQIKFSKQEIIEMSTSQIEKWIKLPK